MMHRLRWIGYKYTEKYGIYNAILQNMALLLMIIIG